MAFVTPYINSKFIAYLGDQISTKLSLAIKLMDDFTKEEPMGNIRVSIQEGESKIDDKKIIKNLSGYYLLSDLATGKYTVSIESDFYFPEKREVDTSKIKSQDVHLEFDGGGPTKGSIDTKLKDVSQLQRDDVIEVHNPSGNVEQRKIINIDTGTKEISWIQGLKYTFTAKESTIHVLKYLIEEIPLKPKTPYPFSNHTTLVRGAIFDSENNPVYDANVEVKGQIKTKSDKNGEFALYFKKIIHKKIKFEIEKGGASKRDIEIILEEGKIKFLRKIFFP